MDSGKEWVKTERGWKPLSDLHNAMEEHTCHPDKSKTSEPDISPDCEINKVPPSRLRSKINPREDHLDRQSKNEASLEEREEHLQEVQRNLSLRYASVGRSSSRESHRYTTLTEAIGKMNFESAIEDQNCFLFVCNTLTVIFAEGTFMHSTATVHKLVHRITEKATEKAIETRMHTGVVIQMIRKAKAANKELKASTSDSRAYSHWVRAIDARLKSLSKLKHQLKETLCKPHIASKGSMKLLDLPDDCLRKIVQYLHNPQDVLNLGLTCTRLHSISVENAVWRELYSSQHSDCNDDQLPAGTDHSSTAWMDFFSRHYICCNLSPKVPNQVFHAVTICEMCGRVFWTDYQHPCLLSEQEATASGYHLKAGLNVNNFLALFLV